MRGADSQSVKTMGVRGARSYDGTKKIKGAQAPRTRGSSRLGAHSESADRRGEGVKKSLLVIYAFAYDTLEPWYTARIRSIIPVVDKPS